MTLYENWLSTAYNKNGNAIEAVWGEYLPKEQKIYEEILSKKITKISGTVKDLSEQYNLKTIELIAFLDGINESIEKANDINTLTEDSPIDITIDFAKLYQKMVEYRAEHLYNLPEWENVFTKKERADLFSKQKKSKTIVKPTKIGRNDPCTCGSGKKHKKCCGA